MNPLLLAARHGPYVLVMGLVAGLALPALAEPMRAYLPHLVVLLLFVTVLRMEPSAIIGSLADLPRVALAILGLQLVLPLIVLALGYAGGWVGKPVLLALLIFAAGPSISGSPNLCMMMGYPPDHAMRLMVVGTALLPLTVLPVFWLLPELGGIAEVLWSAGKLLLTISLTTLAAVAVRLSMLRNPSRNTLTSLEGLSAITLAVFVVGLMPSVSAVALVDPMRALFWIAFACAANFGMQLIAFRLTVHRFSRPAATAVSLIAGNRNIALFFVSLPPDVTAPIMVFIGAYQIPMYLTPLVMKALYRKA